MAHGIGVAQQLPALRFLGGQGQGLGHGIELLGARHMHDVQVIAGQKLVLHGAQGLVQMPRPQAAARHQQHDGILRHAEAAAALLAGGLENGCAHGVARDGHLALIGHAGGRMAVGEAHGSGMARKVLVGKPHHRILLVYHQRYAHLLGGAPDRQRHIPPETHHRIGLHLGEPALGGPGALRHEAQGAEDAQRMVAIESGGLKSGEIDARLGHQARLHTRRRAGEEHRIAAPPELFGKRECRIYMAGGPPARQNDAHGIPLLPRILRLQTHPAALHASGGCDAGRGLRRPPGPPAAIPAADRNRCAPAWNYPRPRV